MENQIIKTQEQQQIRLDGLCKWMPKNSVEKLPDTVKAKITDGLTVRKCTVTELVEFTNALLIDLKDKSSTQEELKAWMGFMVQEFGNWKLSEIKLAHQKAFAELLTDEEGKTIRVISLLDQKQTGAILRAYLRFLSNNSTHQRALKALREQCKQKKEIVSTPALEEEFAELVWEDLQNGIIEKLHILYDALDKKGAFCEWSAEDKKQLFEKERKKYIAECKARCMTGKMSKIKLQNIIAHRSGEEAIVSRCKSIMVFEHLKDCKSLSELKEKLKK